MKKEHLLMIGSTLITLIFTLAILKWQAPGLLGLPSDLELVQVDKKVPPFFFGVFRQEESQPMPFIIPDPLTRVRASPFFPESLTGGPHDVLGFRNRAVPSIADIVIIGDSQTYGNNAVLEQNWPSHMRDLLSGKPNRVYAMATGGWGAVQYLDMFSYASMFRPRVVVVAFYSGNDPLESFLMAYGNPNWRALIPDEKLAKNDAPTVPFPAPESEWWSVEFNDGIRTIFTPTLRLGSNQEHPAVKAGYAIMADVARRIATMAKQQEIQVVFTIIPTKELVYAEKVAKEGLDEPPDYRRLIESELSNIDSLEKEIQAIAGAVYVDVLGPLQKAALLQKPLYSENINGHPVAAGYEIIAESVAKKIEGFVNPIPHGLYGVASGNNQAHIALVNDQGSWLFASLDLVEKNGWPEGRFMMLSQRDFERVPFMGVIDKVDKSRFGP